jgi:uncharacterized protein involved in response to NO
LRTVANHREWALALAAAFMLAAGLAQTARRGALGWRPDARGSLIPVLDVGYDFVAFGFLILAAAAQFPQVVPIIAGIMHGL